MKQHFYIKKNRYSELKSFIREETPSVRFLNNPIENIDTFYISLDMEVEDANKMNLLFSKWYNEDNNNKCESTDETFFSKIKKILKWNV